MLFSGHMIDRPGRDAPRFPVDKEPAAARAIGGVLDEIQADAACIAICGGACGGDLLFAEAAAQRGCAIWLYLPFERAAFIDASVDIAAGDWRHRFEAIERIAQRECVGDASPYDPQAFAENNRRMLAAARDAKLDGAEFHLICLWDGRGGDGPGGTADMVRQAIDSGAVVSRIAPHDLDG